MALQNNFERQLMRRVAKMFATFGGARFEDELFSGIRDITGCDHLSFFTFDARGALVDYHALSVVSNASIVRAGTNFLARVWPRDAALFNQNVHLVCQDGRVTIGRRLASEVDDSEYRKICYDEIGTIDRITLHYRAKGAGVTLGLYRDRKSGPFSEAAISSLKVVGGAFATAAARHLEITDRVGIPPAAGSLAVPDDHGHWGPSKLSRREFEIAERICLGMTTEGIAVELAISPNTVLTYRKRIYAKLGISNQRELLALRYRHPHASDT